MRTQAHIIITQINRSNANDGQNNIISNASSDLFENMCNYPAKTYLRGAIQHNKYALIYYLGMRFGCKIANRFRHLI